MPIRCSKGVGNYLFGGAVIRVYLDSSELLSFHLFFPIHVPILIIYNIFFWNDKKCIKNYAHT